jgi:hypothetical protein
MELRDVEVKLWLQSSQNGCKRTTVRPRKVGSPDVRYRPQGDLRHAPHLAHDGDYQLLTHKFQYLSTHKQAAEAEGYRFVSLEPSPACVHGNQRPASMEVPSSVQRPDAQRSPGRLLAHYCRKKWPGSFGVEQSQQDWRMQVASADTRRESAQPMTLQNTVPQVHKFSWPAAGKLSRWLPTTRVVRRLAGTQCRIYEPLARQGPTTTESPKHFNHSLAPAKPAHQLWVSARHL